jgi:hypothetical protein
MMYGVILLMLFGFAWMLILKIALIKIRLNQFSKAVDGDVCYSCDHTKEEHGYYGECPEGFDECDCEYANCDCGVDGYWK